VLARTSTERFGLEADFAATEQQSVCKPAAPVSHQKRPERSATNAIDIERKRRSFNEADRNPAAHNSLLAGRFLAMIAAGDCATR
jgi:hypothetical protein